MCFTLNAGRTNSSSEWRRIQSWEFKRACHEEALVVLGPRKRSEMVIVTGGALDSRTI
jgi:hypothetical protein